MKKLIFILCFAVVEIFAVPGNRTWTAADSLISTDIAHDANWSPANHAIWGDTAIFDGTVTMTSMTVEATLLICSRIIVRNAFPFNYAGTMVVNSSAAYSPWTFDAPITATRLALQGANTDPFSVSIPDINITGQLDINYGNGGSHGITTGKLISSGRLFYVAYTGVDTMYFTDSVTAPYIYFGTNAVHGRGQYRMGSANIVTGRYLGFQYDDTGVTVGMQSSHWLITGTEWTWGATGKVNEGTSTMDFTDNVTITSNNKPFYDMNFLTAAKNYDLADSLTCSGDIIVAAGTLRTFGKTVHCADFTAASGSTITDSSGRTYVAGALTWSTSSTKAASSRIYVLSASASHTFATGGKTFDTVSVLGNTTLSGGGTMRLYMAPALTLSTTGTISLLSYDIAGTAGNLDTLVGGTFNLPAVDSAHYTAFSGVSLAAGDTFYCDSTCRDLGGNSGAIVFYVAPPPPPPVDSTPAPVDERREIFMTIPHGFRKAFRGF